MLQGIFPFYVYQEISSSSYLHIWSLKRQAKVVTRQRSS